MEAVQVRAEEGESPRAGRQMLLGLRVRRGTPDARAVIGDLAELIIEAERIADGVVKPKVSVH